MLKDIHILTGRYDEVQDWLLKVYKLRNTCWKHSRSYHKPDDFWEDEDDKTAVHFIIIGPNEKVIAAARLNVFDNLKDIKLTRYFDTTRYVSAGPYATITRNIVHPNFQGYGLIKVLDNLRLAWLKRIKVRYCFLSGLRIGILSSYGFKKIVRLLVDAPENLDDNPEVWVMVKSFVV